MVANIFSINTSRNITGGGLYNSITASLFLSLLFLLSPALSAKTQSPVSRNASMIDSGEAAGQDENRSKVDCCILRTVTQTNATVNEINNTVNDIDVLVEDIDARLQCNSAIAFGSAEINQPGGYVITEHGLYCLKEDVTFTPAASQFAPPDARAVQAAITILSSDVFIDLGLHTLKQAGEGSSTQVPYVIGILIPDPLPGSSDVNAIGLQSIYIKGDDPAIIEGFSMYGIRIFAHTYDIRLTNITIKDCGVLASKALRPTVYGFPYLPHTNTVTPGFGPSFGVGGLVIGESTVLGMGPVFFFDTPNNAPNNVNHVDIKFCENRACVRHDSAWK